MERKQIYTQKAPNADPFIVLNDNGAGCMICYIKRGFLWENIPSLKIDELGYAAIERISSKPASWFVENQRQLTFYRSLTDREFCAIVAAFNELLFGSIITVKNKGLYYADEWKAYVDKLETQQHLAAKRAEIEAKKKAEEEALKAKEEAERKAKEEAEAEAMRKLKEATAEFQAAGVARLKAEKEKAFEEADRRREENLRRKAEEEAKKAEEEKIKAMIEAEPEKNYDIENDKFYILTNPLSADRVNRRSVKIVAMPGRRRAPIYRDANSRRDIRAFTESEIVEISMLDPKIIEIKYEVSSSDACRIKKNATDWVERNAPKRKTSVIKNPNIINFFRDGGSIEEASKAFPDTDARQLNYYKKYANSIPTENLTGRDELLREWADPLAKFDNDIVKLAKFFDKTTALDFIKELNCSQTVGREIYSSIIILLGRNPYFVALRSSEVFVPEKLDAIRCGKLIIGDYSDLIVKEIDRFAEIYEKTADEHIAIISGDTPIPLEVPFQMRPQFLLLLKKRFNMKYSLKEEDMFEFLTEEGKKTFESMKIKDICKRFLTTHNGANNVKRKFKELCESKGI